MPGPRPGTVRQAAGLIPGTTKLNYFTPFLARESASLSLQVPRNAAVQVSAMDEGQEVMQWRQQLGLITNAHLAIISYLTPCG